jgi:hypothetical protein
MDRNIDKEIMQWIAKKEVRAQTPIRSIILTAALSERARHSALEHNNFKLFSKTRAVKQLTRRIYDIYFIIN